MKMKGINDPESSKFPSVQESAMHIQIHSRQEEFLIRSSKSISLNSVGLSFNYRIVLKDDEKKDDQKER
jgi:hypothetical protein